MGLVYLYRENKVYLFHIGVYESFGMFVDVRSGILIGDCDFNVDVIGGECPDIMC